MRNAVIVLALALGGCAREGYVAKAHREYTTCLDAKGVDGCQTEKAKLDAALAVADAQSRYNSSQPPLVLGSRPQGTIYQPVVARPEMICTTAGNTTTCR